MLTKNVEERYRSDKCYKIIFSISGQTFKQIFYNDIYIYNPLKKSNFAAV